MEVIMTKAEILQQINNFCETLYDVSSHTYLPEYRASRQTAKKVIEKIKAIAKREMIHLDCKDLTCVHD